MALRKLGVGVGHLKAGFMGFQGSGKSYTSMLLAVAVKRHFKLDGPIAMLDTENATDYLAPMVKALTGQELIGERTRDFEQLVTLTQECVAEKVSVLVADSMTHWWRSLCAAYLAGVNENRTKRRMAPRARLEFADWGPLKNEWARWTDLYLNSPLHLIIAGRAGYEYDMSRNEETGKNELEKTGIKMKTEGEFGFEPSLLVQMEIDQEPAGEGKFRQVRTGTVLKDRFGVIDGAVFQFGKGENQEAELARVFDAFAPHLNMLKQGTHSTVVTMGTPLPVSEEGDIQWQQERKARTILCEEIQGMIVSAIPGMSAEDKKRKADLFQKIFNTRSWTAIESMRSEVLRERIPALKSELGIKEPEPATSPPPEDDGDLGPVPPANAGALAAGIGLLCKAHKIKESTMLGYLVEVKKVPAMLESLAQVPPEVLTWISDEWDTISKQIKDATAPTV